MKGFIHTLFATILLLATCFFIFFIIDFSRAYENLPPLFCIEETTVNDGGTVIYLGIGYKVIDFHVSLNGSDEEAVYYDKTKIGTYAMRYEDFKSEIEEYKKSLTKSTELSPEN